MIDLLSGIWQCNKEEYEYRVWCYGGMVGTGHYTSLAAQVDQTSLAAQVDQTSLAAQVDQTSLAGQIDQMYSCSILQQVLCAWCGTHYEVKRFNCHNWCGTHYASKRFNCNNCGGPR